MVTDIAARLTRLGQLLEPGFRQARKPFARDSCTALLLRRTRCRTFVHLAKPPCVVAPTQQDRKDGEQGFNRHGASPASFE